MDKSVELSFNRPVNKEADKPMDRTGTTRSDMIR